MAHHGGHGASKTRNIREARRARAEEVNLASGTSKMRPEDRLKVLDRMGEPAHKERARLLAMIKAQTITKTMPESKVAKVESKVVKVATPKAKRYMANNQS